MIMKNKMYFGLMLACLGFASCDPVKYQVFEVQYPGMTMKDNSVVYENQDCRISYNLWSENGSMEFIFRNQSEKDIFIDMSQSFFIKNGAAYDYYKGRSYESRTYEGLPLDLYAANTYIGTAGYWPDRYLLPIVAVNKSVALKTGFSNSVTVQEPKYICVPAKTYKVIGVYRIYPKREVTCNHSVDYPKNISTVKSYNEDDSPLKFTNRLAYSFEEGDKSPRYIDNSFWLSSIKNYSQKDALEEEDIKVGCTSKKKTMRFFKIGGPNQFYVEYKGSNYDYEKE